MNLVYNKLHDNKFVNITRTWHLHKTKLSWTVFAGHAYNVNKTYYKIDEILDQDLF